MNSKENCFICNSGGNTYLIPDRLRNEFDESLYYERYDRFRDYILPDEVIIEDISVSSYDLQALIDGDLE